ncbi:GATA zinc finger domain-containing protein 14 isoform X2 [Trifolium pratense]|uniref:GATA zinc finger domain-containing protein 14 isoform X2 n=1 Tax=Trifolium pratense TaxID=57577 RepID=UPI001E696686|nr:GATA zinc finger domain-containing protein 14 isoform X2 [Trifolium pratense]
MSNHNTPPNFSNPPPNFSNPPNNHHPQMGVAGNYQNQNFMQPFIPNMQPPPPQPQPFMNAPNQLHMPQMGGLAPQNNANYNNNNPMFPMHNAAPQMNFTPIQGQILAQNLLNLLQQPNMNMNMNMNVPNGQFCPPVSYPMQNMNQQLPMQMQRQNPSQGVPYGMNNGPNPNPNPNPNPMFGFPNQGNHAMVPQNPMFSGNPQFGVVPGNQVRPQINPNEKNRVPANGNTNGFVSGGPFPPQQLQGNSSVPQNSNNTQSSAFRNSHSQENPNSNINTNFANSNWKGSPNKNFKNKQNRGGSQGGFQKSKFRDNNKGNRKTGFPNEHIKGKGPSNERAGNFGLNSEELQQEPKKSFTPNYSEQEIQQWREARKKNHPSSRGKIEKSEPSTSQGYKVIDREVLQRQLKEVLAKQAELGVEVAEIPSHYLKNGANQGPQSEEQNNTFTDRRKLRNNGKRNPARRSRNNKKQKLADKDFLENKKSSLLQKLMSADIKRDKSYLLQVFRFMAANSFFKDYPGKPLVYPSVLVKEVESEVYRGKKHLQDGKDVLEHDFKIVQNFVKDSENGNDNEDEEIYDEEEGEILE